MFCFNKDITYIRFQLNKMFKCIPSLSKAMMEFTNLAVSFKQVNYGPLCLWFYKENESELQGGNCWDHSGICLGTSMIAAPFQKGGMFPDVQTTLVFKKKQKTMGERFYKLIMNLIWPNSSIIGLLYRGQEFFH